METALVRVDVCDANLADDTVLREAEAWLRADERRRLAGMRRELSRREFLVARWLARRTLAHWTGRPASEFVFVAGAHGRPRCEWSTAGSPPDLNWSHSAGLVVCASAAHAVVGVDVESIDRPLPGSRLERFLSPAEFAALDALPAPARPERFWRLWTAKEAYLKARGTGIAGSLASFTVAFEDPAPPRIVEILDSAAWRLSEFTNAARFRAALAVHDVTHRPTRVEIHVTGSVAHATANWTTGATC